MKNVGSATGNISTPLRDAVSVDRIFRIRVTVVID
jgi:hypothetical protein